MRVPILYWNSANTPTYGSAISYVPEIPWNNSCAGVLISNFLGYSPTYGPDSFCNDPTLGYLLQTRLPAVVAQVPARQGRHPRPTVPP